MAIPCNYCKRDEKYSIPLFPVRAAIAPVDVDTPDLPMTFQVSAKASGKIKYTTRILKKGFLYVFDEKNKSWTDYFVTNRGYYFLLEQGSQITDEMLDGEEFSCTVDERHEAMASFITVKAYEHFVTRLAWSPVRWTADIRSYYEDSIENRIKHMQTFDSGAWYTYIMSTQEAPDGVDNCIGMRSLGTTVAEFSPNSEGKKAGFDFFSRTLFINKPAKLINTIHSVADKILFHGGVIFNVKDPTGAACDLAHLMQVVFNKTLFNKEFKDELFLSSAINQLETFIKRKASDEYAEKNLIIESLRPNPSGIDLGYDNKGEDAREAQREEDEAKLAIKHGPKIKAAEDEAWEQYSRRLDSRGAVDPNSKTESTKSSEEEKSEKTIFEEKYKTAFDAANDDYMTPIINMHSIIIDSADLMNQFRYNFDGANPSHGIQYVKLFSNCIIGTQRGEACTKVYKKWLDDDSAEYNLIFQAFLFNNKELANKLNEVAKSSKSYANIEWESYFDIFKAFLEGAKEYSGYIAKDNADIKALNEVLIRVIADPFAQKLDSESVLINKVSRLILAAGINQYNAYIIVEVTGRQKEFISGIISRVQAETGESLNKKQVEKALRRLAIKGIKINGSKKKKKYFIALNRNQIKDIAKMVNEGISAEEFKIITTEDARRLQATVDKGVKIAQGANFGVRGGLFVVQLAQVYKLLTDKDEWTRKEMPESTFTLFNIAATVGAGLELAADVTLAYKVLASDGEQFWKGTAKLGYRIGVGAGIGLGVLDYYRAIETNNEELSDLYLISGTLAIVGVLLTIPAFTSSALVTAICAYLGVASLGIWPILAIIALSLYIGYLIEKTKGDDIEKWLMRTRWGIPNDVTIIKFKTGADEQKAYRILMGLEKDEEKEKRDKKIQEGIDSYYNSGMYSI